MKNEKEKLKVCLIAPIPPPYGGIANWTKLMLENWPQKMDNVVINVAPQTRSTEGRTLLDRIFISGSQMFKKKKELLNLAKKGEVDIIHMTTSGQLAIIRDLMLLKIAKKNKIPTLYHIRFGRVSKIENRNTIEWKLIKRAMKLASMVIVIDQMTYSTVKKYIGVNVKYIPNPVSLKEMPMRCVKEKKEITFIGWCIKEKGVEELLAAWNDVKNDHLEWSINFIGPANLGYVKKLNAKYSFERVNMLGEKEHKAAMEILNTSSIFVLPSYTEGFPNSVLEAMALKKAIVATNVGAIPEMLSNNCGKVVEKASKEDLKLGLLETMNNIELRREYGNNAYNKVVNCYSLEIILKQYSKCWELLGEREVGSN